MMTPRTLSIVLMISTWAACAAAAQQTQAESRPAAEERFRQLDRNGDGKVTADEFDRPLLFRQMDRDGDGAITPEEARDYVRAAQARPAVRRPAATSAPAVDMDKRQNVRYAEVAGVDANLLSLDVYSPKTEGRHPVMVMIHGGGWRGGDKANATIGEDKARFFVSSGYVYVGINYRLSPAVRHPVHVQDVAKALAYVHDNVAKFGGDPDRIYIMGHSAGAHLAALVATDDRRLKAEGKPLTILKGVILLDGAGYDVAKQIAAAPAPGRAMYLAAFSDDPAAQADASPIAHVTRDKGIPPFLILHVASREDSKAQSDNLAARLREAGVKAEVVPAEGKTHGTINSEIGRPGDKPTEAIMKFLAGCDSAASRPEK